MQYKDRGVLCISVPEADFECGGEEISHFEWRIKLNKHENNVVKRRRKRCSRRRDRKGKKEINE
jgi:hypothetical protein